MVTPKIERDAMSRNYGRFVISPLEAGYGVTLGNALRRVLLSSLSGAAITSIRISDVLHEFSDIPGVKEDTMQVLLQAKQLRLILHEGETARLRLDVRGEGTVTAADSWGGDPRRFTLRPPLRGSLESWLSRIEVPRLWVPREDLPEAELLHRAVGVVYRPGTERASHHFRARPAATYDHVVHLEVTRAVEPLEGHAALPLEEPAETWPFSV